MQQLARPCIVAANRLLLENKTQRLRHTDVRGANPMNTTISIVCSHHFTFSHNNYMYIKDKVQSDRKKHGF